MRLTRLAILAAATAAIVPISSVVRADHPPVRAASVRPAPATQRAPSLFDPARHMRVSEVRPGMKGYGLTVFRGTKLERFEVEVLSVLRNFNPKSDVVLIRCKGEYLEHTGSIAGMSGSPVYLTDADGHDRMIGAFAYGWPMTKDPVAGVQPIEYMLRLPVGRAADVASETTSPATAPSAGAQESSSHHGAEGRTTWSLIDAGLVPGAGRTQRAAWLTTGTQPAAARAGQMLGDGQTPRLEPLATPLMTSGLSPKLLDQLGRMFRRAGLTTLQAGVGGSGPNNGPAAKLEPGSVLAVPLLTGDVEMTAIGTCTEVIGDKVWGFGHPFNNEGPVALPMGAGEINGVIANLNTSFKLGSLTAARGTLTTDGAVGVAGQTGASPPTVPIDLTVQPADGTAPRSYHFDCSLHPKLTPMIAGAAFSAAASGSSELPQYNTVDYDLKMEFNNGRAITLANRAANATAGDLFGDAGIVMQAAAENPFRRVLVKRISGTIKVRPAAQSAQILDVNLPKSKYHPGDTIKAFVNYQSFHGPEAILPVELELPRDLRQGTYQLVISDAARYVQDEMQSKPFQFTAENINDVFAVLSDMAAIRENAIYLRLLRQPDGVAIGHTALPRLPSSRREILLGAGRSNTTAFVSSTVKTVPTQWVMAGSAEFAIQVETTSKVTVGSPHATKVDPAAPTPALVKPDDPHRVIPPGDVPGKKDAPKDAKPGE